jgi:hypothetical protein
MLGFKLVANDRKPVFDFRKVFISRVYMRILALHDFFSPHAPAPLAAMPCALVSERDF